MRRISSRAACLKRIRPNKSNYQMNELASLDQRTAEPRTAQSLRNLPRLRFPAACLIIFWTLFLVMSALDKPYFVGFMYGLASTGLLTLLFVLWWWFSRGLRWWEKSTGFAFMLAEAWVVGRFSHPSIGFFTVWLIGLPIVATLTIGWLWIARRFNFSSVRIGFALLVTLGWSLLLLVRVDGLDSRLNAKRHWRWTPTQEEQFLAKSNSRSPSARTELPNGLSIEASAGIDWTDFRGPDRDGVIAGSRIATNWIANPPSLVWRRPVGPAWSSLLVVSNHVYTQEQRGEKETVVCYDAQTGEPVWVHEDTARFEESVSGAGPRATPTFAKGRLYTLGGTGLLNCLEAETGTLAWRRDIKVASQANVPMWGFVSSPLVAGDLVVVYAGGEAGKGLLAYKSQSGELVWTAAAGNSSYSSPQVTSLAGVPQCLILHDGGLTAVELTSGKELWKTGTAMKNAPRCGQPRLIQGNQLLVAALGGLGCSLIEISNTADQWTVANKWDSRELKPEFPDFVVLNGYAYGFDIGVFCCLKVADGKRTWKEGRYGRGQVMLLRDQNLLLVASESGELVLLAADPAAHRELGRFQALSGKTWNHPVVRGSRVVLRNAEEMACYSVSSKGPKIVSRY
jgi:hypothetical protein